MAPLDQNPDVSLSSHHDDVFDHKTIVAPLHESIITSTPRRVSFCGLATVYNVMSRVDYTHEEVKASWFNQADTRRMKRDAKLLLAASQSDRLVHDSSVSIRGIEWRTKEGLKRKIRTRSKTYHAVFLVKSQQQNDLLADELVAKSYSFISAPCLRTAQVIGKRDEIEAMTIYKNQKTQLLKFFRAS
jgi:hypothetical protein